jgi:hypothetical protein
MNGTAEPTPQAYRFLMVAEGIDELTLVHPGASLDADLSGALLQVLL